MITACPAETPLMKVLNSTTHLPEKEQQQVMMFLQGVAAKLAIEST
ncbi:hypothetical protein [Tenebrionibacter intestinalis]|uniref:Uncharacterized protein n=1 Tax=Tenebrionibacter intestinalis TaxID=2799638 RepID=A0A8K0V834_9ENTR|nr:hypothetical protein [Tenebrionibacter intestinalis]MBK4717088.1 hypothetical protein [Tenebrionibacter intestinalis]